MHQQNTRTTPAGQPADSTRVSLFAAVWQHIARSKAPVSGQQDGGEAALGTHCETTQPLDRWRLLDQARKLLPGESVARCYVALLVQAVQVTIKRWFDQDGKARVGFGGLVTCGSIWHCPVCAAKIAKRRRADLAQGLENAKAQGLHVYLLTQTVRHGAGMSLGRMADCFQDARRRFRNRQAWRAFKARDGFALTVCSKEVTCGGENGWHYHAHELLFTRQPLTAKDEATLKAAWVKALKTAFPGMKATKADLEHGLTIQGGENAGDYVSKWGLEHELAGAGKAGRDGNLTPWGLLALAADGCEEAGMLFQEYAAAMRGRQHLKWDKGLREALGLGAMGTDEELAAEAEGEPEEVLATIDAPAWATIVALRMRGAVLAAFSIGVEEGRAVLAAVVEGDRRPGPTPPERGRT